MCTEHFTTFELQLTKVGRQKLFYCVLIYRPPGPVGQLLSEFTDFLTSIIKLDEVLLVGDFNPHIKVQSFGPCFYSGTRY